VLEAHVLEHGHEEIAERRVVFEVVLQMLTVPEPPAREQDWQVHVRMVAPV
jgi:hypothetical protein